MSSSCPNGHVSTDPEWCDTCGAPLGVSPSPASSPTPSAPSGSASGSASGASTASSAATSTVTTKCPSCDTANPTSNLFCESCGLDFVTGQAPAPDPVPDPIATPLAAAAPVAPVDPGTNLGWTATLTVSADWFAAKGEGIGVPPTRGPNTVELRHDTVVIGRSRSTGASPGVVIDDDHGISRRHAELRHDSTTNTWSITDLGSTNGSFVLAEGDTISPAVSQLPANEPRALVASDRVFLGAWTELQLINTAP